jgi:dihydroorotate dehydrogenase electron transfer subunit
MNYFITYNVCVAENIHVISFNSAQIASTIKPGQFINIKVNELSQPLLRRPFSVYRVERDIVSFIFKVIGVGTKILASKRIGETLDIIGPLGSPYNLNDDYRTALLVAGGIGIAPLPLMTSILKKNGCEIVTFIGAKDRKNLVQDYLENVNVATDDGSFGYHGTVIDLFAEHLESNSYDKPKIFACGPNRMLSNLIALSEKFGIPCEVSLESAMACGIGICQGCPIETRNHEKKYFLVCKDGPVFNTSTIRID